VGSGLLDFQLPVLFATGKIGNIESIYRRKFKLILKIQAITDIKGSEFHLKARESMPGMTCVNAPQNAN
jgi:hypothetical protein